MKPVSLMRLTKVKTPEEIPINPKKLAIEMKYDGYLCSIIIENGVKIYTRRGNDISDNVPSMISKVSALRIPDGTFLIGELLWIDEKGEQNISIVSGIAGSTKENALQKQKELNGYMVIVFYDVLWYQGQEVTDKPFSQRRKILRGLLSGKTSEAVWLSPVYGFNQWKEAAQESVKHGGEGVVIKNLDSTYHYSELGGKEPKPSNTWWKWKPKEKAQTDDFVVYDLYRTEKDSLMAEFGQYNNGKLYRVGRIDSFSGDIEKEMLSLMKNGKFVIELGFEERTKDGKLRHPSFIRIRNDKDPKDSDLPDEHVKTLEVVGEGFEISLNRLLLSDNNKCHIDNRLDEYLSGI